MVPLKLNTPKTCYTHPCLPDRVSKSARTLQIFSRPTSIKLVGFFFFFLKNRDFSQTVSRSDTEQIPDRFVT